MLKVLLKKQLLEILNKNSGKEKNGKKKSSMLAIAALYAFSFAMLGFMFFKLSQVICEPLVSVGYGWLYFAIMGIIAIAIGIFGSVFSTYASMYLAKDNELLLSMPIRPRTIITSRLLGVLIMGLFYQLVVMAPAVAVYYCELKELSVSLVVLPLLSIVALAAVILCFSCLLGWLVAFISSKLKGKNYIVVILSLAFIVGYYLLYNKAHNLLMEVIANPLIAGDGAKTYLYPLYKIGQGAVGDWTSMLLCLLVCAAFVCLVYVVLCNNFLKIATTTKAETAKSKAVEYKSASINGALLKKELKRLTSSATYMLNCSLGTVAMPVLAVVVALKLKGALGDLVVNWQGIVVLFVAASVCALVSLNYTAAASVSFEGRELWIINSLPIKTLSVLNAKLKLQLLLTVPAMLIYTVTTLVVLGIGIGYALLVLVTGLAYCFLTALAGLCLNLKMPKLDWTTEAAPAKQSAPVTICLLGGWALTVALTGIYYLIYDYVSPAVFLGLVAVLFSVSAALLYIWLKVRGTKIFSCL